MDLLREWIAAGALETGSGEPEEAPPTAEAAAGADVTYSDLQPIFEETCGQCHGETATKGLKVTDYETLMEGSEDGPVIVPGSPDESKILEVLEEGHFGQLTDDQMDLLRQWIEAGAPEGEVAPATE
jgi:mono/diheme cytochrome c family protein